jgi:hypothetical protein
VGLEGMARVGSQIKGNQMVHVLILIEVFIEILHYSLTSWN